MENKTKEFFRSIQDMLGNVDDNTKEQNRIEIIELLKEFYNKLFYKDSRGLKLLECAKIIDLFADIQNVIIYLETGQDTNFNPNWSC